MIAGCDCATGMSVWVKEEGSIGGDCRRIDRRHGASLLDLEVDRERPSFFC